MSGRLATKITLILKAFYYKHRRFALQLVQEPAFPPAGPPLCFMKIENGVFHTLYQMYSSFYTLKQRPNTRLILPPPPPSDLVAEPELEASCSRPPRKTPSPCTLQPTPMPRHRKVTLRLLSCQEHRRTHGTLKHRSVSSHDHPGRTAPSPAV